MDTSRLSGVSASNWEAESCSSGGLWSDEDYEEQDAADGDSGGQRGCDLAADVIQRVAEHRADIYREVFAPSLTRHAPVTQRRARHSTDLTHMLFAAAELDCSVSDVAEEIQMNAAQAQDQAIRLAVNSVLESVMTTVQFEAESEERQRQQLKEDQTHRPMYATRISPAPTICACVTILLHVCQIQSHAAPSCSCVQRHQPVFRYAQSAAHLFPRPSRPVAA